MIIVLVPKTSIRWSRWTNMTKSQWRACLFLIVLVQVVTVLGCGARHPADTTPAIEPTPTAIGDAEAQPPADWLRLIGRGVSISLPPDYQQGDLENDPDVLVERLKLLGPAFAEAAKAYETDPSLFVFLAFAPPDEVGRNGASVNIVRVRALSTETLDQYVSVIVRSLTSIFPNARVTRDGNLTISGYPAARLLVEFTPAGGATTISYHATPSLAEVVYVLRAPRAVYEISFSAASTTTDALRSTADLSAHTFLIDAATADATPTAPATPSSVPANCGDQLSAEFDGFSQIGQVHHRDIMLTARVRMHAPGCSSARLYFDGFLPTDSPWCAYWLGRPESATAAACRQGGVAGSLASSQIRLDRADETDTFTALSGLMPPHDESSPPNAEGMRLCAVVVRFYSAGAPPKDFTIGDPCFLGPRPQ